MPDNWWDELPPCYEIRRRWPDIVRFHEALKSEVARDGQQANGRIKKRMPDLPSRGNLDAFLQNIAATGDACALSKGRLREDDSTHEELSNLHAVYVEKYLAPYFSEISAILCQADPYVLRASKAFRQFATSGPSSLQRHLEHNFSAMMDEAGLEAASQALRGSWQKGRRPDADAAAPPPGDQSPGNSKVQGLLADFALTKVVQGKKSGSNAQRPLNHYRFFAQAAESEAFGSSSYRELEHQMEAKERRELARRTLRKAEGPQHPGAGTMEYRPQLARSSPVLLQSAKVVLAQHEPLGHCTSSPSSMGHHRPDRNVRLEMMIADICAGLRTIILNEAPPDRRKARHENKPVIDINSDERVEGSPETTLVVYRTYRSLLEEDIPTQGRSHIVAESGDQDAGSDDDFLGPDEEQRHRRHEKERTASCDQVCPELMPIDWQTFFTWIDRKSDLAEDCRVKSACQALLRALKIWRQVEASVAQSCLGVSLNMLFQWVWPCAKYKNVARMLAWIGRHEFEKIRQPTPRVISKESREQLEGIFCSLSSQRGDEPSEMYITAEDLAGGASQDTTEAKLRNIVDVDTVLAVYGRAPITLLEFLEIMCEDNFRGHEDATLCTLEDGRRLVYVSREVTGCRGWLFQDAPQSEESQRAYVEAIEVEVDRWNKLGTIEHGRSSRSRRGSVVDPKEFLPPQAKQRKTALTAAALPAAGFHDEVTA
jgi:hypothetical protein